MAHSIELRVPYLDRIVMEEAAAYPAAYKIAGDTKAVLRAAANKTLPDAWANRKKKGFPVPIAKWLEDKDFSSAKLYLRCGLSVFPAGQAVRPLGGSCP